MRILDIKQNTEVVVNFYEGITENRCEELTENLCEKLYIKLNKGNHDLDYSFEKDDNGDYRITFTETGTVKYYEGSYYEPDDYDDPTTLSDDDFEDAVKAIRDEDTTNVYEDEIASVHVCDSEWEVC